MRARAWWGPALGLVLMVTASAQGASTGREARFSGVVNLNQATAKQLDELPGIGEKAAAKIIEHRQKAPFQRPEELVKVKGFGKKRFERLRPYLAVNGPTTFRGAKR